jgi:hypothetical protein
MTQLDQKTSFHHFYGFISLAEELQKLANTESGDVFPYPEHKKLFAVFPMIKSGRLGHRNLISNLLDNVKKFSPRSVDFQMIGVEDFDTIHDLVRAIHQIPTSPRKVKLSLSFSAEMRPRPRQRSRSRQRRRQRSREIDRYRDRKVDRDRDREVEREADTEE